MPATIGTREGKILIEIYPQIPDPPSGAASVVCYFFKTYRGACTYDTSDAAKTVITLYTPEAIDYFQSEIPIIITTEGSTGKNGLELPKLVQRYNFYMYFFKDLDTDPHEVAFADYVPDFYPMPAADFSIEPIVKEANEYSILKVIYTNNYHALQNAQYEFVLTFTHTTNSWEDDLGWGAKASEHHKHEYPCIAEDAANTDYYCEIRPGEAQGTESQIVVMHRGPINMAQGSVVTFHFPKIQLGTNSGGNMVGKWTIREYTPGQLTTFVEIATLDFSETGLVNQDGTTTFTSATSVTYSPFTISATADAAFSFPCTSGVEYVIYEFEKPIDLATQVVANCDGSGGKCYVFKPNVNWVYYVPSAAITSGTCTTSIDDLIVIYPASRDLQVNIRAGKTDADDIVDRRFIRVTVPTGDVTGTLAIALNADEANTYQNSVHTFDIQFTNVYEIPNGGKIVVTIAGATLSDPLQAIEDTGSALTEVSSIGVVFRRDTAVQFTIWNFDTIAPASTVSLKVRLLLNTDTTPSVSVTTYLDQTNTYPIDEGGPKDIASALTLTIPSLSKFEIVEKRMKNRVRVSEDGEYKFQLTLAGTYTSGNIDIIFPNSFSLPNNNDILVCRVNGVRRDCNYNGGLRRISLNFNAADWTASTPSTFSFYTDYSPANKKGLVASAQPQWHQIFYTKRQGATIEESNSEYIFIPPVSLTRFLVTSIIYSVNQQNMYIFTMKVSQAVLAYSAGGRIYIDFPTGADNFADDLGTGKKTGGDIACIVSGGGISTSTAFSCHLIKAVITGDPATVEVKGFDAITVSGNDIVVTIAKVNNPATTNNKVFEFSVRMNEIDTTTAAVTYIQQSWFTYPLFLLNTAAPTTATVASTDPAAPAFTGAPGQEDVSFTFNIYSAVALAVDDYFIIELPDRIGVRSTVTNCPVDTCWFFPVVQMVVYKLGTAAAATTSVSANIESITTSTTLSL